MPERLALDVSRTYISGWLGKRGNDRFPCTGSRIVRVEFNKEVSAADFPSLGHGDAYTIDTDLPDVGVHYWIDAGTKLVYHLKVWVED